MKNKIKSLFFIMAGLACICTILFINSSNVNATEVEPESLFAPEYDVWCEGPPRNCLPEIIITPDQE
ncbi:MAG: hypothetical protein FH748_01420 [Balneolaceae bacterium]|nr:hypothetical protein [Balneolaceae bacterium]